MTAAVVLFSGGLDSLVALAECVSRHGSDAVVALTLAYGQRHYRELVAAKQLARHYQVEQVEHESDFLADLCSHNGSCALLKGGPPPPDAPPDDPAQAVTVVPYRNGIFIAQAVALAVSRGAGEVWIGCNRDDAAIYADCSGAYLWRQRMAVRIATSPPVDLIAPHVERTKAEVVKAGRMLGAPLEKSWSCYAGRREPCGKCGACRARTAAMA